MVTILAYFDPGSGSLLMQAIVGGAAGLAVFGKYLWNVFTDRFQRLDQSGFSGNLKVQSAASSGEIPINPL
jgi:hypothetical protein